LLLFLQKKKNPSLHLNQIPPDIPGYSAQEGPHAETPGSGRHAIAANAPGLPQLPIPRVAPRHFTYRVGQATIVQRVRLTARRA
jgi:hypothetical protein